MGKHATEEKDRPPLLDPVLQSKLVAKFGAKLMKRGFTALPRLVQEHYRYVPGNTYLKEVVDGETGEVSLVEKISHMTPTEYVVMTAIWSYWWTSKGTAWPSVEQLRSHLGKSERQVRRYLQQLRDKGFMISQEQFNSERKQISNSYHFEPFLKRLLAYLEALELREKRDHVSRRDDKNDGERMSKRPGRGCQNDQANQIESDLDPFEDRDSDSSGSAADQEGTVLSPSPACSHIAHGTIRNANEDTNILHTLESHRKPNRTPENKENGAGGPLKEAEENNTGKRASKWEEMVQASGVPLEHLEAMEIWLKGCPRPEQVPWLIQGLIDPLSRQFNNAHLIASNRTQATKLYLYARAQGFEQEELDDVYRQWVPAAERLIPPYVINKMAWFFRALKLGILLALQSANFEQSPVEEMVTIDGKQEAVWPEGSTSEEVALLPENVSLLHPSPEDEAQTEAEEPLQRWIPVENPEDGWPTHVSAKHWADRLREHYPYGINDYGYEVLPASYDGELTNQWVFVFYAHGDRQRRWATYRNSDQVKRHLHTAETIWVAYDGIVGGTRPAH